VFPDMFSLAQAHKMLDAEGDIESPSLKERFERTIVAFMDLVEAAKHYPCAKKAWFEYLGEPPEGETARAE
ncbi:MAG TPA: NADPH-dependent oxidoreductase, partial [Chloroflexia bacterium]|nr:NADPH-dependent oxidoreductase [Chloroflexia bacterium]